VPREINAIGVRLDLEDRRSVLIALLIALAYLFAAFLLYAGVDFVAWTRAQIEGRELIRGTAADRQRHRAEYEKILRDHQSRGEMADKVETALMDFNTSTLRNRTARVIVPLVLLRGGIDFLVPTVVAVTGIVWLALEIGAAPAGGATATVERTAAGRCLSVPRPMVAALKSGLKAKAQGRLGTARAVRSRAHLTSPRGFAAGTYFVSAPVRGFGVATWAADARAFRTGGGFITAVGPVARRVSVFGIDLPAITLRLWGLTESTDGYAASRRCVQ
jgi:hypothetical protein